MTHADHSGPGASGGEHDEQHDQSSDSTAPLPDTTDDDGKPVENPSG